MIKRLLLCACAALALTAGATVPVRRTLQHRQPDGTLLTVTVEKNGRFATYATADGRALLRRADGHFCYARLAGETLEPTEVLAHDAALRTDSEAGFVRAQSLPLAEAESFLNARNPRPMLWNVGRGSASTADGLGRYGQPGNGVVKSIGSFPIPVILVDFADKAFQPENDSAKVSRFFNEQGYADEPNAIGSVRDFFVAQSNGAFSPSFEVVAHVQVSGGYSTYGANGAEGKLDIGRDAFVSEAVAEAAKTVDFSRFRVDGSVPLVTIMFAGPGEQSSFEDGYDDYLWACFARRTMHVNDDSVTINSYFIGSELLQQYGSSPNDITGAALDGVGLFCHEFGHALGLPDFYYTGRDKGVKATLRTMSYWDIMDYGQYFLNGYAPPGYTAYERSVLGWLDVRELTDTAYVELYPFGSEDKGTTACVLRNPENEKEYFLFENRQPSTWYPARMGSGMLVLHVDYDANAWAANTVNNDSTRQRMEFVPADGVKDGKSAKALGITLSELFDRYKGDLFPGTQNVTSITAETPVAFRVNTPAGVLDKPLYNITLTDEGVVTFSFLDPKATGISSSLPTVEEAQPAAVYTLSGRRVPSLSGAPRGVYILSNGQKVVK